MKNKFLITIFTIFSSLTINIYASWRTPPLYFNPDASYDYLRLKPYTSITLNEGDIAWFAGGRDQGGGDVKCRINFDDQNIYNYNPNRPSQNIEPVLTIGPCTINNGDEYINLKIDRQSSRQNKYTGLVLGLSETLVLEDGDHAWYIEGENIKIEYPDGLIETGSGTYPISGHDRQIYGPSKITYTRSSSFDEDTVGYFVVRRATNTGSRSLQYDEASENYIYSDGKQAHNYRDSYSEPNNIKYDELLGWAYFTDTPWVYSYKNLSWYYLHSRSEGLYVWNANLPNNGWMKLRG